MRTSWTCEQQTHRVWSGRAVYTSTVRLLLTRSSPGLPVRSGHRPCPARSWHTAAVLCCSLGLSTCRPENQNEGGQACCAAALLCCCSCQPAGVLLPPGRNQSHNGMTMHTTRLTHHCGKSVNTISSRGRIPAHVSLQRAALRPGPAAKLETGSHGQVERGSGRSNGCYCWWI